MKYEIKEKSYIRVIVILDSNLSSDSEIKSNFWMKTHMILKIDVFMAYLGCFFSPALLFYTWYILKNPLYSFAILISFLSFLLYFKIINSNSNHIVTPSTPKKSISVLLNLFFIFLFISNVILLYFRENIYIRPLSYFILISIMCPLIVFEILFAENNNKFKLYPKLIKIIFIALSLEWSQLIIYPSIIGKDPFIHKKYILELINSGIVPNNFTYSHMPVFHLMVGIFSIITDLNYKISTMLSISLLQIIIDILFIFLIGKLIFNEKVGLLGALFVSTANRHIQMGFWTIPNTIAAVFVPMIIYLLFSEKNKQKISITVLLMLVLILTHTVTSMWMCILLFTFYVSSLISKYIYACHNKVTTLNICILFTTIMYSWWIFVSGHFATLVKLTKLGFSIDAAMNVLPSYSGTIFTLLSDNVAMFSYFAVSLIGCFYMLSVLGNQLSFSLSAGALMTLAITFFGQVLGKYIITGRWEYFSYILLAIPLGLTIFLIYSNIRSRTISTFYISIFVFLLIFFMVTSSTANMDNPLFSPEGRARYAFLESEVQALNTVSDMWNKSIYTDGFYLNANDFSNVKSLDEMLYSKKFYISDNMHILIRKEILQNPIQMFRVLVKLDYDPRDLLEENKMFKFYDCGTVFGYSR